MFDGKTDKEGKLTVKYLPAGKYTYKETKAPSGYALNLRRMRSRSTRRAWSPERSL